MIDWRKVSEWFPTGSSAVLTIDIDARAPIFPKSNAADENNNNGKLITEALDILDEQDSSPAKNSGSYPIDQAN